MGSHVAIIYYLPVKSALAINILDLFDFAYYHITFVMFYGVYLCMILAHLFDQAKTKIKKYTLTEKIITQSYSFKE
jgi:hypothetical protein